MKKINRNRIAIVVMILLSFLSGYMVDKGTTSKPLKEENESNIYEVGEIQKGYCYDVESGDIIFVKIGEQKRRIKLIGVGSPKIYDFIRPDFYAAESKAYTKSRLLNKSIYLEKGGFDYSDSDTLRRFVWLNEPGDVVEQNFIQNNLFNAMSIKNGYSTSGYDNKYTKVFDLLQSNAEENKFGQWNPNERYKWEQKIWNEKQNQEVVNYGPKPTYQEQGQEYIGNARTKKFHYPWCASVGQMNESNKVWLNSRDEAISWGYVPCQRCYP